VSATGIAEGLSVARLLYSLAARRFTGQVGVEKDARRAVLYLTEGLIVDADSPCPEDALGRVLLEAGMVSSAQVGQSLQRLAEHPGRRQLDILVELGALQGDAVVRAQSMGLVKRAVRIFQFEGPPSSVAGAHGRGEGATLDARWLVYRGLRLYYDEKRLDRELAPLAGQAVKLTQDPVAIQESFGFADEERICVAYLQKGYWQLGDLVDACVHLARPIVLAVATALYVTETLDIQKAESVPRLRKRAREETQSLSRLAPSAVQATAPRPPAPAAHPTPAPSAAKPPLPAAKGEAPSPPDAAQLIQAKLAALTSGADHFRFLDLPRTATRDQIKTSYFQLAKIFHPDRLAIVQLGHLRAEVERIFARLSEAFAVLSDDSRRKEYLHILAQGGEEAVRRREEADAEKAAKLMGAEDHFQKGEAALRRSQWSVALAELKKAVEQNPEEGEHHALYAWATYVSAPDKSRVHTEVQKGLSRALELNPQCVPACYYQGQVALQGGDPDTAVAHFQKTLKLSPGHVEAERELRLIEMRRAKGDPKDKKGAGLFDRFRKK
jgi:tetratricopeptide (TPR) repeat protein